MPRFCCFLHPDSTIEERTLTDVCSKCGRPYGFPITHSPRQIGDYSVVEALDRGFYSAAYIVESGPFKRRRVIKVVPDAVYTFFSKRFDSECQDHARAADGSQHIANIYDMKAGVNIAFGDVTIPCSVAELDYIPGLTLHKYLAENLHVPAITVAQLAIDLFSLLGELQNKTIHHNDLHAGNLIVEQLDEKKKRADAEDPHIRIVAIDLNSVADSSKSDAKAKRLGDLHWVVNHLRVLVDHLLADPDTTEDIDYRLAALLEERAQMLSPGSTSQRTPTFDECIEDIRTAVRQQMSPWREPPRFRRFKDAYNAQTLAPWFVPYLLVDPEEHWLSAISTQGPQVIIGMRGCGKTMLLRALQFHARAIATTKQARVLSELQEDRYLGLYASCTKLLDQPGTSHPIHEPYARLFVTYAVEAIRAIRHLRELYPQAVVPSAYREIGAAVADYVTNTASARTAVTEFQLERILLGILVQLNRGDASHKLPANPAQAFPHLADAIRSCATIWRSSQVFFLLDDVSTRYLDEPSIRVLLSSLLFVNPTCAFKLTTEAQTLELILRSPGQIEHARSGRDYEVFDLGAEVNALNRSRKGTSFIEDVLLRRAQYFQGQHSSNMRPSTLLGDIPLEAIAATIGSADASSRSKKKIYHGITALAHVCVGDIGDIISIYDLILRKAPAGKYPVSDELQSDCFQDFCSRRLYELNRRSTDLKDFSINFAEASHQLLVQSYRDAQKAKVVGRGRIRQYLKVYVRITSGDPTFQFSRLRDLVDSGVFVLDGGSHRTKTRDSDPIQQFKLTYRKLFGLSNFIGLSERDRFELSGSDLEEWLQFPSRGRQILLRNLGQVEESELDANDEQSAGNGDEPTAHPQPSLFDELAKENEDSKEAAAPGEVIATYRRMPVCNPLRTADVKERMVDTLVVGLGFEARSSMSVNRLLRYVRPRSAICIRYKEDGKSGPILTSLDGIPVTELFYEDVLANGFEIPDGSTMIDITGLAKPVIFHVVRTGLRTRGSILICHTRAKTYYPLDTDIDSVLKADQSKNYYSLLEELRKVLTGEVGPYNIKPLLKSDSDETRRRILFTFASPKHERLLALLDARDFDKLKVMAQSATTPRGKLAKLSADFVAKNFPGAEVEEVPSIDMTGTLKHLADCYHEWYVEGGFNFEVGLTGSKLQTVACAAASATLKINQCWYVGPKEFDKDRFTKGVADTRFFELLHPDRINMY